MRTKLLEDTFNNPAIFAEELLQGLLCSFGVQSTDEELSWSVCLRHARKYVTTCNNGSYAFVGA